MIERLCKVQGLTDECFVKVACIVSRCYGSNRNHQGAIGLMMQALERAESTFGLDNSVGGMCLYRVARTLADANRLEEAQAMFNRALLQYKDAEWVEPKLANAAMIGLGKICLMRDQPDKAVRHFTDSLELYRRKQMSPIRNSLLLAVAFWKQGKMERAIEIWGELTKDMTPEVCSSLFEQAGAKCMKYRCYEAAIHCYSCSCQLKREYAPHTLRLYEARFTLGAVFSHAAEMSSEKETVLNLLRKAEDELVKGFEGLEKLVNDSGAHQEQVQLLYFARELVQVYDRMSSSELMKTWVVKEEEISQRLRTGNGK